MEKNQFSSTIFDDVFKTIVEKLPWLLVPLINEVFGTDYEESELIVLSISVNKTIL